MIGFGRGLAVTAMAGMCAALMSGAFGCELISTVDRSLIDGAGGSMTSSSSASSSTGGPECAAPKDCPAAPNECVTPTCNSGKCGTSPVATGTPIAMQTAGDCKVQQCDGKGAIVDVNDDTDKPDDKNACTDNVCTAGKPSNPPSAAGTTCGTALTCDGKGDCTGCATAASCPGTDDECQTKTCTAGVCGATFTATGTAIAAQTAGDCKVKQCDGSGAKVDGVLATDIPVDMNPCTDDLCTGNVPSNPNTMSGAACNQAGGTVCNGSGACVACITASTCPAAANECQVATCTMGACGIAFVPAGTNATTQVAGDCHVNKCDGAGNIGNLVDNADLPNDNNPCTNDVCTAGVASHTSAPGGTTCGAGQVCNATGSCTGCVTAASCPGPNNECQTQTCTAGVCGTNFTAAGTATTAQTAGDCKKNTCNGAGAIVPTNDNLDVPVDNNQCTSDVCNTGSPSNPPAASGLACSQMGGTVCNGNSVCVQCLAASACPGVDTDCKVRTCSPVGACGFANTAAGTVTTAQTAGDCQETQCNGNGATMSVAKNTDLPVDANQCTDNVCTAGVPSNPNTMSGAACSQMGGVVCSGTGTCVACVTGAQCTSGVCTNNVCQAPSCTDGIMNGAETGLDCGGTCLKCLGAACTLANECSSATCTGNVCSLLNGCDFSTATNLTGMAGTVVTFANGNLTYAPKCIKVTAGTMVTFNGSFSAHPLLGGEVVAGAGVPASSGPFVSVTNTGTTKAFTMATAGTFPYYCTAHASSNMDGVVYVVP